MTHRVIKNVLNNGSKTTLLHVYLENNGLDSELTNYELVDPVVYDAMFEPRRIQPDMKLTIAQVWYNFAWFDGLLAFDSLVPSPSWVLPRDAGNHIDFRHFGGLADRLVDPATTTSTDRTGKILLSTSGFAVTGARGTMILEIRKNLA